MKRCSLPSRYFILGVVLLAQPNLAKEVARKDIPDVVFIPAGEFVAGSDHAEREMAYELDEAAYGHTATRDRKWYAKERKRQSLTTGAYFISRTPITNRQYAQFISATGRAAPTMDARTWASYGLVHPFAATDRFRWENAVPPPGRGDHPVVLVSYHDALAYAAWLSKISGDVWRLPAEVEWEKAARGVDGRYFPWGDHYNVSLLNSHDKGPFDTVPVAGFAAGGSPFGTLDAAGQVYEWTTTPAGKGRVLVKGGSWDDRGCGVCRPAARHGRPLDLKHILIGFRLIREIP